MRTRQECIEYCEMFLNTLAKIKSEDIDYLESMIKYLKLPDSVESRKSADYSYWQLTGRCSNCNEHILASHNNFCPNCGAQLMPSNSVPVSNGNLTNGNYLYLKERIEQ